MIKPIDIGEDEYIGQTKIKAYCYLREAERTFILDRIVDAMPEMYNINIINRTHPG
jgi:predicted DNA-binding transcriptional regulator YafY